jgi:hypothetical protein
LRRRRRKKKRRRRARTEVALHALLADGLKHFCGA